MKKIKSLLVVMLLLLSVASIVENSNSLDQPFPVYGYIKDSDGNAIPGGVTVTVKDNTKSTQISVTTQSNGYYQADLFNLQNCENGDTIEIYCSYSGEDNSKTFTLDVSQTSKNVSFSLVGKPDVSTNAASNVGSSSAKLNGELNDLKDTTCQVWFEYGKTTSYGSTTSKKTKTATGAFSATISGLQPDTTYHFRAVAKNSRKTSYGADKTFHTSPTPPQVTTNDASNVGYNSATLNGHLDKVGASSCKVWFVYDTMSHTSTDDYAHATAKVQKNTASSFSAKISGLSLNITYHFRAVAENSAGTAVGDDITFTTHIVFPSVETEYANATSSSAILKGNLDDLGGESSCQVWFEYGETTSYGYSTNISISEGGEFTAQITNLQPGKLYHFRAAAKNSKGISYGSDKNFTTPAVRAKIETSSVEYAIILKANITDLGGDSNCTVWFEYNESGNASITKTPERVINSTGIFSEVISGLEENTTYHYRAVINNSQGISYGANLSFKMLSLPASPVIKTMEANASFNNATLYANLTSMGDSTYCYVWFEYWNGEKHSTSVRILNSTGMFNESVEGLDDGETYYYRAIAVGSNGRISYGNIGNFSTDAMQNHEPSVVLISPDNNSIVNTDVSLMVDVGDEDGDMLEVSFYLNGNKIYSVESTGGTVSVAPALSYKENYEWYVSVSDGKALNISDIYEFSTIEEMIANFTNPMLFENEPAHFTDSSTGEIVQWLWDFGDGNTSNERNATHTYKKAGCYDVNLTVKDRYGNSMYIVKEIEVWQRGDANMDGSINALDVTRIERIAKHVDNEPSYPNPADVDRDNDVDNEDVHAVINKILGSV
ncbi:MAG: hypothetical protein DRN33_03730 [Thermoplasmata archaeon]|nr:MAG: hypothetical protein DRN33_03730 [Thermoplasmata archaeon]